MPNWYLGEAQNAVDGLDITGQKVEHTEELQPAGERNTRTAKESDIA